MSDQPARPGSVPADCRWNAGDREWELGARDGERRTGEWKWWREDGSLACVSSFDDGGELHGVARRFHPSGEPSLVAPYVHGKLHGKQIATRPSSGDSPEMRELLALDHVYRTEILYVSGVSQPGVVTLYAREGLFEPIACDDEGVPSDLSTQLHKLRPGTALELLTPFLEHMGQKTPKSMIKSLRYICPALVGGAIHRVEIEGRRGQRSVAIVPIGAFERGLALAVDRGVARLSATP